MFEVDFEKACDSLSWSSLDFTMEKMGFRVKWKGWIMEYVSLASMAILVKGAPTKIVKLNRGLKQNCPLSPFLFNIV